MENSIDESFHSSETSKPTKGKKQIHVEKIGQSEEYDQSLLKRRK